MIGDRSCIFLFCQHCLIHIWLSAHIFPHDNLDHHPTKFFKGYFAYDFVHRLIPSLPPTSPLSRPEGQSTFPPTGSSKAPLKVKFSCLSHPSSHSPRKGAFCKSISTKLSCLDQILFTGSKCGFEIYLSLGLKGLLDCD